MHDAFVACICEQLKRLDVCSSTEEYECTSEAVVSFLSAPAVGNQDGAPPLQPRDLIELDLVRIWEHLLARSSIGTPMRGTC